MPNLPISGLPASDALTGAELFADVQGGVTKYTTLDDVTNYVTSSIETHNQNNSNNSYLVPVIITGSAGGSTVLTGSIHENTTMFQLTWNGGNGVHTLTLPDCTTETNTYRRIRFISDGTVSANDEFYLEASNGQTLDGSTGEYQIDRTYEGIMVWSDGTEWFRIQTKA